MYTHPMRYAATSNEKNLTMVLRRLYKTTSEKSIL